MIPRYSSIKTSGKANVLNRWHRHLNPLAQPIQRHWLTCAGPLTAGLRELGELKLRVVRQSSVMPTADEQSAMKLARMQPVLVREICMSINDQDCVVARSAVSQLGRHRSWRAIDRLGRRPLADILYDDWRVARSAFETARVREPHPLARLASSVGHDTSRCLAHTYWARRSVFWRGGDALLVSECFLPAFWALNLTRGAANE